jgi:hypothetical protein
MDLNALFQALMGSTYDQTVQQGQTNFPELPVGSRHHRQGSEQLAGNLDKVLPQGMAFLLSQLGGLGIEGLEAMISPQDVFTQDTGDDLLANFIGGMRGAGGSQSDEDFYRALFGFQLQPQPVPSPQQFRPAPGSQMQSPQPFDPSALLAMLGFNQ